MGGKDVGDTDAAGAEAGGAAGAGSGSAESGSADSASAIPGAAAGTGAIPQGASGTGAIPQGASGAGAIPKGASGAGAMAGAAAVRRGPVVAALMLGMALAALDGTIVSTAVPQIVADLGGFTVFSWLFAGYLLAVTVTLPVYGKLSDTFGRKPVLITGIALFLVGSVLCALAWNMTALIAFRIVQGLGGGAIQGTVQTVAADLYPLKERPKIQAKLSTVWAVSSVAGPALGGVLASYAHWRWIFLINLPVGAVATWLIAKYLREPGRAQRAQRALREPGGPAVRSRVDWPGALAVFACGGVLLTALVQGGVAWPWLSAPSLALFATSAVLVAVVVTVERRAAEPILPGWVWRRRTIAAVNVALGALGLLMVAPTVFLPTYAQSVLGLDPTAAGFVLSIMTLSWPVSAALSQHLYRRIGFRQTAIIGISLATTILLAFPLLPFPGAAWQPALIMLLLGAALGIFQLPLIVGVQSTVGWSERGTATASILFYRQLGQSVGAALFGAVANATLAGRLATAPEAIRSGLPDDLDSVSHALTDPHSALGAGAAEYLRRAVDTAVDRVYVGAAAAGAVALLALVVLAPRRFPVLAEGTEGGAETAGAGAGAEAGATGAAAGAADSAAAAGAEAGAGAAPATGAGAGAGPRANRVPGAGAGSGQ